MELVFVDKDRKKLDRHIRYSRVERKERDESVSTRDHIINKYNVELKIETDRLNNTGTTFKNSAMGYYYDGVKKGDKE